MNDIIKKIEALGYYVGNHKDHLVVGKKIDYDADLGVNILENTFTVISQRNEQYSIEYFVGQIPTEKKFNSDADLLDFIVEVFPVK